MRLAVISTDAGALGLTLGAVTHAFPEIIGGVAGALGCAWYALQIYDRVRHGPTLPPERLNRDDQ